MTDRRVRTNAPLGTVAAVLSAFLFVLSWRSKVVGLERAEGHLQEIRSAGGERRLLFYYLIEDAIPLLVLVRQARIRLGLDFASVCGNTWMGRVVSAVLMRLGRRTLSFRFEHATLSIKDVKALVREPAPLTISADGRGPYGHVHPDLRRLVEGRDAIAVPISVCAARSLRLCGSRRVAVPWPGGRIAIAVGAPVAAAVGDEPVSTEALEAGLRAARAAAKRLLVGSEPRE